MAGDAALASVGGYQLEGIGIHLFERVEGDYFTILGLPLLPLLAYLRQNGFDGGLSNVHPRPHRLARHGKVDHGEVVRRGGRAGARRRRRGAPALRGRGGGADRGGVSGHAPRGGKVDRAKLGERVLGDPAALQEARGDRASAGARGARSASWPRPSAAAPRSRCSTFRCCSRPAARRAATRWWWCPRRPSVQRARVFERPGMTEEKFAALTRQADAGRGKARAGRFRRG